jgi:hypothetical protein
MSKLAELLRVNGRRGFETEDQAAARRAEERRQAADALDVAYKALRDVRNDIDGPAESIRTIDAAIARLDTVP